MDDWRQASHREKAARPASPWIVPGEQSRRVLDRIRPHASRRNFRAGETLIEPGERVPGIYFLTQGQVKEVLQDSTGRKRVVAVLSRGCAVGVGSALDGEPSQLAAVACTDVEALFLPRERVRQLVRQDREFCLDLLALLCRGLRAMTRHVADMSFRSVQQQLACLLQRLAHREAAANGRASRTEAGHPSPGGDGVSIRVSHQQLADLLGVSRVTVSQCLAELKRRGLIETGFRVIRLVHVGGLTRCGDHPDCISVCGHPGQAT